LRAAADRAATAGLSDSGCIWSRALSRWRSSSTDISGAKYMRAPLEAASIMAFDIVSTFPAMSMPLFIW
jgi:hypothetical protein